VRKLSGITFPGAPYNQVFFVADAEVAGSMVQDEVNAHLWREGFHLLPTIALASPLVPLAEYTR
jgi:hypothetical protein